MSEKKELKEEQLNKVSGGMTWEEQVEASRNLLPEGDVTCLSPLCKKTFNAKDNAHGFMNVSHENGMNETYPIAMCPYCGAFWSAN